MVRNAVLGCVCALACATAAADTKPSVPALQGATVVATFKDAVGFVDDPVTGDSAHVAYVISDGSASAKLHVVTLADKSEKVVELAGVTAHPIALELVGGTRAFVVGQTDDGNQVAALVELADVSKAKPAGTAVYKLGPANHIQLITRDGKRRAAVHKATATKAGTRHEVDVIALDTGSKVGTGKALELDANNASSSLEFKVNHWSDGWTKAYGIKGGHSVGHDDARSPDVEASYDLVTGKFDTKTIADLFEQHKRFQVLADAAAGNDFVRMQWDNSVVQIWSAGKEHDAALDQPITNYDPKSLQGFVAADGTAWFALKVDPVNPDAVARKKADPEYLDVFKADASGKTTRQMRVLATGARHRFGMIGDKVWLLERNNGFERGGKALTIYTVP